MSLINDKIRIEAIWDHKNGRRFQVIVVNKTPEENFTVHRDAMARNYLKLKLTESDIMELIAELRKSIGSIDFDPEIVKARSKHDRLKVVKDEDV